MSIIRLRSFSNRHPFLGAALYVCCIQYYFVQVIVAMKWASSYNLRRNTISDLGNTHCGLYGERFACSPYHGLMNISFIALGLLMVAGSFFVYQKYQRSTVAIAAFTLIAFAGFGAIMVGIFPENSIRQLHIIGAALSFILGNAALVCFGFVPGIPKFLRYLSLAAGCISLISLFLFYTHFYLLGIGIGGIERIVAYPQSVWLIVFGMYMLKCRT